MGCGPADSTEVFGESLYDEQSRGQAPEAALNASLGCGVPTAVADLHEGETVLDSGREPVRTCSSPPAGSTRPARRSVSDMTDEMLDLARANAAQSRARTTSSS